MDQSRSTHGGAAPAQFQATRGRARGGEVDLVRVYMGDIGERSLLGREDEEALGRKMQRGVLARRRLQEDGAIGAEDRQELERQVHEADRARQTFVEANLRLVVFIAKQYRRGGTELMDAVQAGNIGLLRAVEGYDWRLGYRFSTYASWWVRQAIVRELAEAGRGVHLPALVREEISTLARTRDRLRTQEGREPGAQALADALGWTRGRVSELLVLAQATVSLSVPVGDGGGPELAELLADEEVVDPSDSVADGSRREDVARLVDGLGGHQAAVLRLRYGLDGSAPRSIEQVGKVLGLSRERVRQLEGHALRRLREDDGARSLRPVG